jgi:hypothetical protein
MICWIMAFAGIVPCGSDNRLYNVTGRVHVNV